MVGCTASSQEHEHAPRDEGREVSERYLPLETNLGGSSLDVRPTLRKKVLVAVEERLIRDGLRAILSRVRGTRVVGEASEGREAVQKSLRLKPDVIIMDISMPVMDGIEATRRITEKDPDV